MISRMIWEHDTDTQSSSVFEETHRFLWWTWIKYRWVSYFYMPGDIHTSSRIEGYADTASQAIVAAKMDIHRP